MANNTTKIATKQPSGRASVSGGILSILSLISAAIGYGLAHAHYSGVRQQAANETAQKIGTAVTNGTVHVLGRLFSLPFLVIGLVLAVLAIVLTLGRLRKVRAGGLVVSVVWLACSVWAVSLAIRAFDLLKYHAS